LAEAHTTYGRMGIKVWIMKGEVYGKRDLSPLVGMDKKQAAGSGKGGDAPKGGKPNGKSNSRKRK
jgi:small subunit ribosomal protein S3